MPIDPAPGSTNGHPKNTKARRDQEILSVGQHVVGMVVLPLIYPCQAPRRNRENVHKYPPEQQKREIHVAIGCAPASAVFVWLKRYGGHRWNSVQEKNDIGGRQRRDAVLSQVDFVIYPEKLPGHPNGAA